jgi:hypothetical protein
MAKTVAAKKRCCKSKPRCRRCPTVLKRLERAGLAQRKDGGGYMFAPDLKPRHVRAARRD